MLFNKSFKSLSRFCDYHLCVWPFHCTAVTRTTFKDNAFNLYLSIYIDIPRHFIFVITLRTTQNTYLFMLNICANFLFVSLSFAYLTSYLFLSLLNQTHIVGIRHTAFRMEYTDHREQCEHLWYDAATKKKKTNATAQLWCHVMSQLLLGISL